MCACADVLKFKYEISKCFYWTWIRAAKLNLKIPIHSEDINDMECTGGQKNKKQTTSTATKKR